MSVRALYPPALPLEELLIRVSSLPARKATHSLTWGWSSVNPRQSAVLRLRNHLEGDVRKKVDMDLEYIRERSATADLAIMARTMPVMIFRKIWT